VKGLSSDKNIQTAQLLYPQPVLVCSQPVLLGLQLVLLYPQPVLQNPLMLGFPGLDRLGLILKLVILQNSGFKGSLTPISGVPLFVELHVRFIREPLS